MPKRATQVLLSEKEQDELEQITKRHRSEQQQVLRARIVLAAAQGRTNAQIAHDLAINVDTARLWRDRWVGLQGIDWETLSVAERLQDAPRPGAPPKITPEQRCQIAALACEAPMKSGRPISQWTGREIADELKTRGVVAQISPRHASYLLKKGGYNRTAFAIG
jgi:putative transposase